MNRQIAALLLLSGLPAIVACNVARGLSELLPATAGRRFDRPADDELVLGSTGEAQVLERFGRPFREGTGLSNDCVIRTLTYTYASSLKSAHASGATSARSANFDFHENSLVSYVFSSSMEKDHTDFDETIVGQIGKGESREEDVLCLFGRPSGRAIFPVTGEAGDHLLIYSYTQVRVVPRLFGPRTVVHTKHLRVTIDREGWVKDVHYSMSGEK